MIIAPCFALATFAWCGIVGPEMGPMPQISNVGSNSDVQKVAIANADFSQRMLRLLASKDPRGNVFISPYSIGTALAITMNGARGATQAQMARTLGLQDLSLADANAGNRRLLNALNGLPQNTTVSIANSVWLSESIHVIPQFSSECAKSYDASIQSLNFSDASAADSVNQWVSHATRGRIPKIVTARNLKGQAAVLANAIYFKAEWSHPFRTVNTHDAPFHLAAGLSKSVSLMNLRSHFCYGETPEYQAVELPYGEGRLSMTVILPRQNSDLGSLLGYLDLGVGEHLLSSIGSAQDVDLFLPRFKADFQASLKDALRSAGMPLAFGREGDFKNLSPQATHITDVFHVANLDLNERGTTAAAATTVMVGAMAIIRRPEPKPIVVRVDHPFLLYIRDRMTGTILFAGAINDPKSN